MARGRLDWFAFLLPPYWGVLPQVRETLGQNSGWVNGRPARKSLVQKHLSDRTHARPAEFCPNESFLADGSLGNNAKLPLSNRLCRSVLPQWGINGGRKVVGS